jgi:transposase-like protein
MAGESATRVAQELQIGSNYLSKWWANYRRYGPEGLRPAHRPRKTERLEPLLKADERTRSQNRVKELERKIGQQQVELDFFQKALRQVGETRRPSDGPGVKTSMLSSRQ